MNQDLHLVERRIEALIAENMLMRGALDRILDIARDTDRTSLGRLLDIAQCIYTMAHELDNIK